LAGTGPGSLQTVTLPPGQEVIELGGGLRNVTDEPLEITKLRPTGTSGVPARAEIARVALVERDSIDVGSGPYVTFPPVTRADGTCVLSKVLPARGFRVAPDKVPLILVWVRAVAAGRMRVPAVNVTYEQGGELFRQAVRIDGVAVIVRDDAEALRPSPDERACASQVQLLPGAVRI
jgi:hypothetical protein